jgi:Ca2+-binding EF-hand superfamily protein
MQVRPKPILVLAALLFGPTAGPSFAQEEAETPAAPTPAQRFAELDKDSDGKLTREEVGEDQRPFFNRLVRVADADEDGALTREEFIRGLEPAARQQPEGQAFGGPRGRGDADEFLRRLDRNGDGKIAKDELPEMLRERLGRVFEQAGKDALTIDEFRQATARAGGSDFDRGAYFDRLDTDRDGRLALKDVPEPSKAIFSALLRRAGKGEDAVLTKEEFVRFASQLGGGRPDPRPTPPPLFAKLDRDRDGALSKEELAKAVDLFGELDANGDGRLDPGELFRPDGQPQRPQTDTNPQRGDFLTRLIKDNDRNEDGKLSRDEAPERMRANFERADRNSDGSLDADELRQAFTRRQNRPQQD